MTSVPDRLVPSAASTATLAIRAAPVVVAPTVIAPTTQQSPEHSLPGGTAVAAKALEIISEQSGVPVSDLQDETRFDDIGIDSLLSLMITSQFAEELDVNADSNFFLENNTIGDVKRFFGASNLSALPIQSQDMEFEQPVPVIQATVMPVLLQQAPPPQAREAPPPDCSSDERFSEVVKIISEEAGVPVEQLADGTSLASLGVDSLLSLMIGSRLRDELDIDIDTSSIMSSLDSIRALREALFPFNATLLEASDSSNSSDTDRTDHTPPLLDVSKPDTPPSEVDLPSTTGEVPPTTSVILQGNTRTCAEILFFFPDGSGLASSYVGLPRIRENLVVYGLNSPYLKKGIEMNCTW